jgi:hypothetical protein
MAASPVEMLRQGYAVAPAGQSENRHELHELTRIKKIASVSSAVGAALSCVNLVAQASRRRVGRASRPAMELAARRHPHPQPGTATLLRHEASFPLAAATMPPPAGLGRCEPCACRVRHIRRRPAAVLVSPRGRTLDRGRRRQAQHSLPRGKANSAGVAWQSRIRGERGRPGRHFRRRAENLSSKPNGSTNGSGATPESAHGTRALPQTISFEAGSGLFFRT